MEEIDLKELFDIFWSKKIVIIFITAIFICMGIYYTKNMTVPDYKSTSTLVLARNTSNNEIITQTEVTLNQKLVATYTTLVESNTVLREVISNLKANISEEELRQSVSVKLVPNSQLIEISVTNRNPNLAKDYTEEITKVFVEKVKDIYKMDNINIVDIAKIPEKPYNINHKTDVIIFTAIGFIIACLYVFIRGMMDTTIKTAEEAERRLGLPVIALIPNYNYKKK